MSHTPGPWTAKIGETITVRDSEGALLASLHFINGDGCRRDADEVACTARLMAAAPELLEALKYVLFVRSIECTSHPAGDDSCANCRARNVIAKATGGAL